MAEPAFDISVSTSNNTNTKITTIGEVQPQSQSLSLNTTGVGNGTINAAGSASTDVILKNLEKLKNVGSSISSIKLGSLFGEVAPMAIDIFSLGSFLLEGLNRLSETLLANNSTTAANPAFKDIPAEVVQQLTGSTSVANTLSSFSVIRSYAVTAEVFSNTLSVAQAVMKVIEELLPIAEITSDLMLTLFSGGTSAIKASEELTETIEDLCQKLIALALAALRKFLFNLKLDVPSYLIGSLNTLSIADKMKSQNIPKWLDDIMDEDFYQQAINSSTWEIAISQAIEKIRPSIDDVEVYHYTRTRGDLLKELFTAELVKNFMEKSTKIAREKAQIINYENLEWNYYSNAVVRTKTLKENKDEILDYIEKVAQNSTPMDEESIIKVSGDILSKMS